MPYPALTDQEVASRFRPGLFDPAEQAAQAAQHAASSPFAHYVIPSLVSDALLRAVRAEVTATVSFTPKETDIYRIHQSGDLANLDGLDAAARARLPALLRLRDALYSSRFRAHVAAVTGCGPLSGRKTDMAVNVYTPGCYLLCHDDVIGSRRVSYILYLTDPDTPWRAEWGGALRLYPVTEKAGAGAGDATARIVEPDAAKTIPPAWNQLSFFAVQPGVSFHDVEEVYHAPSAAQLARDGGRVRMAISGWFHIPQPGEDGWVAGAQEAGERDSGRMQLQGSPAQYDLPAARPVAVGRAAAVALAGGCAVDGDELGEADLEFLLRYMAPTYLTPDTLERVAEHFEEHFSITLPVILTPKFAERLKAWVAEQEAKGLPKHSKEIEKTGAWRVARPPHKHRFLYLQPGAEGAEDSPLKELLEELLPSRPFKLWLQMATRSVVESHDLLARRFRRGEDYTLATGHGGKPRLELNIGITPTPGWGDNDGDDEDGEHEGDEEEEAASSTPTGASGEANGNDDAVQGKGKGKAVESTSKNEKSSRQQPDAAEGKHGEVEDVGGHEVYMAGDEDAHEDAAVYTAGAAGGEDEDDNILFFQAAAWNKMTLVLRDSGTLRFVKYVSRHAKGDRWDISGTFEIEEQDQEPEEEGRGEGQILGGVGESEEDVFRGFSPSENSESD